MVAIHAHITGGCIPHGAKECGDGRQGWQANRHEHILQAQCQLLVSLCKDVLVVCSTCWLHGALLTGLLIGLPADGLRSTSDRQIVKSFTGVYSHDQLQVCCLCKPHWPSDLCSSVGQTCTCCKHHVVYRLPSRLRSAAGVLLVQTPLAIRLVQQCWADMNML
jgi:hypothetical protein